MKNSRLLKSATAIALSFVCVAGIAGCSQDSSSDSDGAVAATVNGVEILEDTVTNNIQNIRTYYSLDDDDTWAQYLSMYGMTAEELRSNQIDALINQELINQFANEYDADATDEEIDESVETMKANYSSDEAWESALTTAGFADEQEYRDAIAYSITYQNLEDKFAEEAAVDDETLLENAPDLLTSYDGTKKSSHILFSADDTETAQSVLDQINAGTLDFAEAAETYSTDSSASDGGNVGWDTLNTFVTEYQTALDELEVGQVSGLVESDYGIHIIECTDEFNVPDELVSLDQIPEEILEQIKSDYEETAGDDAFDAWLQEKYDSSEIVINDMPEGLPYDVDMSAYETDDDEDATDESADDTEAVTDDAETADGEGDDVDSTEVTDEATDVEVEGAETDSAETE
jgi:foldase protein PrsA